MKVAEMIYRIMLNGGAVTSPELAKQMGVDTGYIWSMAKWNMKTNRVRKSYILSGKRKIKLYWLSPKSLEKTYKFAKEYYPDGDWDSIKMDEIAPRIKELDA